MAWLCCGRNQSQRPRQGCKQRHQQTYPEIQEESGRSEMNHRQHPNLLIGIGIAIVMLSGLTIAAQTGASFIAGRQQNDTLLRNYEWKSRTTVQKDGEVKNDQLFLMSYDENGNPLKVTLAKTPEMNLPGGLRGVIAKKKKEEFISTLTEMEGLAKAYGDLSAQQ